MNCENIILYDMDGTLADYEGAVRRDLQALAGPAEPDSWTREIHGSNVAPWIERRIRCVRKQPDWWLNLKPLGQQFALLNITRGTEFTHHILTKGPRKTHEAWSQKVAWCHKHVAPVVPDMKVTITEDKGLVYGRVLVDDYPDYMDRWLEYRPRGLGIMPAYEYNKDYSHPRVIRYDGTNLLTIIAALNMVLKRQPGEDWDWESLA